MEKHGNLAQYYENDKIPDNTNTPQPVPFTQADMMEAVADYVVSCNLSSKVKVSFVEGMQVRIYILFSVAKMLTLRNKNKNIHTVT